MEQTKAHPYLLSYPGKSWSIRGGENFRSAGRERTSPRNAFREWLALADAIASAGGDLVVMPPPDVEPTLTGAIYCANYGEYFGERGVFCVSRMTVDHRAQEPTYVERFAREVLGVDVTQSSQPWEGQADVLRCAGGRQILTWGVRTVEGACEEVRGLLPKDAKVLEVQIRDPYFHGDTCLLLLRTSAGLILLVYPGALVNKSADMLATFARADLLEISEADALAYGCNALQVGATLLVPKGVGLTLLGILADMGLVSEILELEELFGKGGGGPRCLVNELRGFDFAEVPESFRYDSLRSRLYALMESYPHQSV